MTHYDIYTRPGCRYCVLAKDALTQHGATYTEINADESTYYTQTYTQNGDNRVPKVWADGGTREVGGYRQLITLLMKERDDIGTTDNEE